MGSPKTYDVPLLRDTDTETEETETEKERETVNIYKIRKHESKNITVTSYDRTCLPFLSPEF